MRTLSVFFFCFLFNATVFSQVQETITSAFETGDVETISQHFADNVDLTVLETEGIYSKSQSKVILQNFFNEHSPGTFTIRHKGGTDPSKFIIGNLVTNGKSYRIYVLFKTTNNNTTIQKIRIEND